MKVQAYIIFTGSHYSSDMRNVMGHVIYPFSMRSPAVIYHLKTRFTLCVL